MQIDFVRKIKDVYQGFSTLPPPLQVGVATLACLLLGGISLLCASYKKAGRSKQWKITFTPDALTVGVDQRIKAASGSDKLGKKTILYDSKLYDSKRGSLAKKGESVGWDSGKVTKVGKGKNPYTKKLSVCLGIAARGYKEGSVRPDYLAVHHITRNPSLFEKTLTELVQKVQKGTIEIFITGGDSSSKENYQETLKIIEKCKTDSCDIVILDDTYAVTDVGSFFVLTEKLLYPFSPPGIDIICFDDDLNPVQSIEVSSEYDVLSPDKRKKDPIDQIYWEKQ